MSLSCSPPIPSFPPIREKGGGGVEFSRARLSKETADKLVGLPLSVEGEAVETVNLTVLEAVLQSKPVLFDLYPILSPY